MKVGILTFHRATNYGAILQAYGLVSYLRLQGHDVQVLDYKPESMGSLCYPLDAPSLAGKLKRLALNVYMLPSLPSRAKKRRMFWGYVERTLPLSNRIVKDADLQRYDAIIVGSDQVWSTKFTGGLDRFYWGQFDRKGARLIAYAGSAAEDMEGSFYSTDNVSLLGSFDFISVREEELKAYLLKQFPNRRIIKVLDPTLLAGRGVFDELVGAGSITERPYVLIYQVIREKDKEIQQYARMISQRNGLEILEIKQSHLYAVKEGRTRLLSGFIEPIEFVSLFKNASYIITTSFHGVAFSLIFNRPFNAVTISREVDSRAKDLLEQVGLGDRMISLPQEDFNADLDWDRTTGKLADLRTSSEAFLAQALG